MKKNYRKTPLEKRQHDTAVKVRKMTDAQLCDFIDDLQLTAAEERIKAFFDILTLHSVNHKSGIGAVTIKKLEQIAKEEGFLHDTARSN